MNSNPYLPLFDDDVDSQAIADKMWLREQAIDSERTDHSIRLNDIQEAYDAAYSTLLAEHGGNQSKAQHDPRYSQLRKDIEQAVRAENDAFTIRYALVCKHLSDAPDLERWQRNRKGN